MWLPPIWRYAFFMILTNSFRVFSPKQLNLGKSNFGQESDELLFQSQRILLTITKSHFSSRIQNQSKFVDWPKISLAHKSRRRDGKIVANTGFAEENQVTRSWPNEMLQPYHIICPQVRCLANYTIVMSSPSVHFMRFVYCTFSQFWLRQELRESHC